MMCGYELSLRHESDRGDVDDRVLVEAILPLLATLAAAQDVRPVLHRRFDMPRWFASQARPRTSYSSATCGWAHVRWTCEMY